MNLRAFHSRADHQRSCGITNELLNRARSENEKRKAHAKAVAELETAVSKAGGIVKEMLIAVKSRDLGGAEGRCETLQSAKRFTR